MIEKLEEIKYQNLKGYNCWSLLAICNLFNLDYKEVLETLKNMEVLNNELFFIENIDNTYYLSALVWQKLFTKLSKNPKIITYFNKIAIKEELTNDIIRLDFQKDVLLQTEDNLKNLNYEKPSWQQDIDNQGNDYLKFQLKGIKEKKRMKIKQYFEE